MGMERDWNLPKNTWWGFCTDHINGNNTAQHTASLFDEHQPSSVIRVIYGVDIEGTVEPPGACRNDMMLSVSKDLQRI